MAARGAPGVAPRAVVVGAGPAGALAALLLRRGGYAVTVFERLDREGRRPGSAVLSARGLAALAGIEGLRQRVEAAGVVVEGRCAHLAGGGFRAMRSEAGKEGVSVACEDLAACLIAVGRGMGVVYELGTAVLDLDLRLRAVRVMREDGRGAGFRGVPFDLCVIAEGTGGEVRERARRDRGLKCAETPAGTEWKTWRLPPPHAFHQPPDPSTLAGSARVARFFGAAAPACAMVVPPRRDGELRGVLSTPPGGFRARFGDANAVTASFAELMPFVYGPRGPPAAAVEDLLAQPVSRGVWTVCSRFDVAGCCVVVGDAAHSCWPTLGQGADCALESVAVLAGALFTYAPGAGGEGGAPAGAELARRLRQYTVCRKPDADAAGRLSLRDPLGYKMLDRLFFASLVVLAVLAKVAPLPFFKPAMSELGNPRVPYTAVLSKQAAQSRFIACLAVAILGACTAGLAAVSRLLLRPILPILRG